MEQHTAEGAACEISHGPLPASAQLPRLVPSLSSSATGPAPSVRNPFPIEPALDNAGQSSETFGGKRSASFLARTLSFHIGSIGQGLGAVIDGLEFDEVSRRYDDDPRRVSVRPSASQQSLLAPSSAELCRSRLQKLLRTQVCEMFIGFVIVVNLVVAALEADLHARNVEEDVPSSAPWIEVTNTFFFWFYIAEATLRIYAERKRFFANNWNNFDFFVVCCSIAGEVVSRFSANSSAAGSANLLRTFRIVRLVRAVRIFISFQELWALISGLISAMRTLVWASLLIATMLTIWSIVAVETLNAHVRTLHEAGEEFGDCAWCKGAFSSVFKANLTFFQFISGGDWTQIGRPLMDAYPYTSILFVMMIMTMVFGMLNLITAVIVDNAAQAREADLMRTAANRQSMQTKATVTFRNICCSMDMDGDGCISLQELRQGAVEVPELTQVLRLMDIELDDLEAIYEIIDQDGTGNVDYETFTTELWKLKSQETRTTLMFIKHYILDIRSKVRESLTMLREEVLSQHSLSATGLVEAVHERFDELYKQNAASFRFAPYVDATDSNGSKSPAAHTRTPWVPDRQLSGSGPESLIGSAVTSVVSEPVRDKQAWEPLPHSVRQRERTTKSRKMTPCLGLAASLLGSAGHRGTTLCLSGAAAAAGKVPRNLSNKAVDRMEASSADEKGDGVGGLRRQFTSESWTSSNRGPESPSSPTAHYEKERSHAADLQLRVLNARQEMILKRAETATSITSTDADVESSVAVATSTVSPRHHHTSARGGEASSVDLEVLSSSSGTGAYDWC